MKITEKIYKNCGLYFNEGKYLLFIAVPGYFASSAWCTSEQAYNAVSGRKFEGITADDGKSWMLDRSLISRLDKDANVEDILENACDEFKNIFNERFMDDKTSSTNPNDCLL